MNGEELFARYLRQRREMGEAEVVLDPAAIAALRRWRLAKSPDMRRAPFESAVDASVTGRSRDVTAETGPVSVGVARGEIVHLQALEDVRGVACACTSCGLAATRTNVVFADGNPGARLVVVGEAPGADEDREGLPFVGRAGKLLDRLLASVGFPRSDVYICNVLKCRPPRNRNPAPDEVEACSPFLHRQIELVAPEAILAVGAFPAQNLLESTLPIGRLRGTVHEFRGIPLVPTYHPAALLRNPAWVRPVWEDLQRLRATLDR